MRPAANGGGSSGAAAVVPASATSSAGNSPLWTPSRPNGSTSSRLIVLTGSSLHVLALPLLTLALVAVGVILVYLRQVLLPFVIGAFIVYILRPLVNFLTTPFSQMCSKQPSSSGHRRGRAAHQSGGYERVPASAGNASHHHHAAASANDAPPASLGSSPDGVVDPATFVLRAPRRPGTPPKYPKGSLRGAMMRAGASLSSWVSSSSSAGAGLQMQMQPQQQQQDHEKKEDVAAGVFDDDDEGEDDANSDDEHDQSHLILARSGSGISSAAKNPIAGVQDSASNSNSVPSSLGPLPVGSPLQPVSVVGAGLFGSPGGIPSHVPAGSNNTAPQKEGGSAGMILRYRSDLANPPQPTPQQHSKSSRRQVVRAGSASAAEGRTRSMDDEQQQCGLCCGPLRITRCPRWFAIVVSLGVAASLMGGLVLLIVDAIQRFQQQDLELYVGEASKLAEDLQRWLTLFGIHLDAGKILEALRSQISLVDVVQTTLTLILEGVGNVILILLLVLYLLAEQSTHAAGSLRAKVDSQIERYLVLKTAISAAQGFSVFLIFGYGLSVRMAHLWGAAHFLLNFIPTAGPIVATLLPMPVVLLDPALSVTAKIAAFVIPSVIHLVVGNVLEPVVFGSSMELHPITVLLALAIWYSLWGVAGAILAVPLAAVMRIVARGIDHTYARIAVNLLEGRMSLATQELAEATAGGDGLQLLQQQQQQQQQQQLLPPSASSSGSFGAATSTPFNAPTSFALGPSLTGGAGPVGAAVTANDVEQGFPGRAAIFIPGPNVVSTAPSAATTTTTAVATGSSEIAGTERRGNAADASRRRRPSIGNSGSSSSSRSDSSSPPTGSPGVSGTHPSKHAGLASAGQIPTVDLSSFAAKRS